jgi:hypothetical protein
MRLSNITGLVLYVHCGESRPQGSVTLAHNLEHRCARTEMCQYRIPYRSDLIPDSLPKLHVHEDA